MIIFTRMGYLSRVVATMLSIPNDTRGLFSTALVIVALVFRQSLVRVRMVVEKILVCAICDGSSKS